MVTNKLLTFEWAMLNEEDKAYLNNDKVLFNKKKALFFLNSKLSIEIRALHEKLKITKTTKDAQDLANKLLNLDDKRFDNYKKIDIFDDKEGIK